MPQLREARTTPTLVQGFAIPVNHPVALQSSAGREKSSAIIEQAGVFDHSFLSARVRVGALETGLLSSARFSSIRS